MQVFFDMNAFDAIIIQYDQCGACLYYDYQQYLLFQISRDQLNRFDESQTAPPKLSYYVKPKEDCTTNFEHSFSFHGNVQGELAQICFDIPVPPMLKGYY